MFFLNKKQPVYIIDGLRTPIVTPHKAFDQFSAVSLAAAVIKKIVARNKVNKNSIAQVILGNVVSAGLGQNFSRQAAIAAGLPETVSAFSVNNVCGAGLQSVILAAQAIKSSEAEIVIAGGAESTSNSPLFIKRKEVKSQADYQILDSAKIDGLFCPISNKRMGDLAEQLARKYHISRRDQDLFALKSHQKSCLAYNQNEFKEEIVPVKVSGKAIVNKDDRPRANLSLEYLGRMTTAFKKKGTVTAWNCSIPCDGAAAVLVASEQAVNKYKLKPLAKIVGYSSISVRPALTFEAGVDSIRDCLKKNGLNLSQIDLWEISEAFASQVVFTKNRLGISEEKLNVKGGDVAFGHPLGAAGTRILVTLAHALRSKGLKRGATSICYGGGGAITMILER